MKKIIILTILTILYQQYYGQLDTTKAKTRISINDIDNPYDISGEELASFIRSSSGHGKCIQMTHMSFAVIYVYFFDFLTTNMSYNQADLKNHYPIINGKDYAKFRFVESKISVGKNLSNKYIDIQMELFNVSKSNDNKFINTMTLKGDYSSILNLFVKYWNGKITIDDSNSDLVARQTFVQDEIILSLSIKSNTGKIEIRNKVYPKKEDFIVKLK